MGYAGLRYPDCVSTVLPFLGGSPTVLPADDLLKILRVTPSYLRTNQGISMNEGNKNYVSVKEFITGRNMVWQTEIYRCTDRYLYYLHSYLRSCLLIISKGGAFIYYFILLIPSHTKVRRYLS